MNKETVKMFVNLPVKSLKHSIEFFAKLGFTFNARFTDENTACMLVGASSYVMLRNEPFFKTFTAKEIVDAAKGTEAIVSLMAESREEVDALVNKALASGGKESNVTNDQGFIYTRSFQDPDDHLWEIFFMEESAIRAWPNI